MPAPAGDAEQPSVDAGPREDERCITCGDLAVPLRVFELDEQRGLAQCGDDQGRIATVEIALVGPVVVGDLLLVHAGTAIGRAHPGAPGREAEEHPSPHPGTPGREAEERPSPHPGTPGREAEDRPSPHPGTPGREAEEVPGI